MQRLLESTAVLAVLFAFAACASTGTTAGERAPVIDAEEVARVTAEREDLRGQYVVVDLEANLLRFMDGRDTLWAAPVGTGTGLHLRGGGAEWTFSTPDGVFEVKHKELDPVWILPDWHFVKHDLPIPPVGSDERKLPGALGVAAVYLNEEIAIHGTDRPDLLGQRVSHGCIRLENEYALRLFHNVRTGTPVLVIGGDRVPPPDDDAIPNDPGTDGVERRPRPTAATGVLLSRLDNLAANGGGDGTWVEPASELIRRGVQDDAQALRGILGRAGITGDERFEREYSTFVADAYARGSWRAVVSLARIPEANRARAARAIVEGTMDQYPGSLDDPAAPWPSRRLLGERLGPEGRVGWEALREAEREYRERYAEHRLFPLAVRRSPR